jgi:hypothetical protein
MTFSLIAPIAALVARAVLGAHPFIPPPPTLVSLTVCHRLEGSARVPSQTRDGAYDGEDEVSAVGCSIVVLCRLALEWLGIEMETLACCWRELSAYCSAATPRMSFSYWYTLPTLSVEGAGRVSKSDVATATFWLALGKVGCGVPSWLMTMDLARAQALL